MIYDRIEHRLYNSVKDIEVERGINKESIIANLQDGTYMYFKRKNLCKYVDSGKIDISENEIRKYIVNS